MTDKFDEPVCWNCEKKKIIELASGVNVFLPCDSFVKGEECKHSVFDEIEEIVFEKAENEYEHRKVACPSFFNKRINCDGKFELFGGFAPCEDCSIDWKKLRINIKYEPQTSSLDCENCRYSTNSMECIGGGFKSGYNKNMEIECQNWEPMVF
jgi:hypothetical protein